MNRPGHRGSRQALRLATAAAALTAWAAVAAPATEAVSAADLQAAAQTLQFLESLPRSGALKVGVVYGSDRAAADEAARSFGALPAPNATRFDVTTIPAAELQRYAGPLDLLLLLPGTSASASAIADTVRARHVASISSDPGCLLSHCCVLMVRSGERMDIVLDTALADAANARFSMVFTMMVKRK
jgi:hypothetical protein